MKKRIIEHASIFMSFPMTLEELAKRTNTTEEILLKEFREELYFIDENMAQNVNKVLNYLKENNKIAC